MSLEGRQVRMVGPPSEAISSDGGFFIGDFVSDEVSGRELPLKDIFR